MDHFPLPKDATPIQAPYRGNPYSTGDDGFSGYPARCGWTKEHLSGQEQFGGRSSVEVEAFFQSWLYFGGIIEILSITGIVVETNDFLDSSLQSVSSKNLPSKLRMWNRTYKKASKSVKPEWSRQASSIINELDQWLRYIDNGANSGSDRQTTVPVSDEIFLSMLVLCNTLGKALLPKDLPPLPVSALLRHRIEAAGWCPMDIARALKDMGVDGHYYMAGFVKPLGPPTSHQGCTETSCTAAYVDEDDYVTQHTDECRRSLTHPGCDDEHVKVDVGSIVRILDDGGFPVIYWDTLKDSIQVDEFNADAERKPLFVAISHVWADGMGNPHENSLPRCQLVRLQQLVNSLAADIDCSQLPIRFWVDTLCIPVPCHLKKYRNISIQRMRNIYQSSAAVLVVESLLGGIQWADTEFEKSLCIYFSKWNKRLWTFQEGFLAPKLMLQFADKAVCYRDSINFHQEKEDSIKRCHCVTFPWKATTAVMSEFVVLRDFILGGLFGDNDYQALPIIVSMIQHRTTSKLSDQTICTCAIMGKDPGFLITSRREEYGAELHGTALEDSRMEAFLKMVGRFYLRSIFNTWPRLNKEGFRWAPRTLLGIPKDAQVPDVNGDPAVLTEDRGLLVKLSGMLVSQPIRLRHLTRITYHLAQASGRTIQLKLEIHPSQNLVLDVNTDTEEDGYDHFAVIFSYPLPKASNNAADSTLHNFPRQRVVVGTLRDPGRNSGQVEPIQIKHYCVANAVVLNSFVLAKGHSDTSVGASLLASPEDHTPPPPSVTHAVTMGVESPAAGQSIPAGTTGGGAEETGEENVESKGTMVEDAIRVECEWLGDDAQWLIV